MIIFKRNIANIKSNEKQETRIRTDRTERDGRKGGVIVWGVPVCGANFSTPALDQTYYIGEIHYRIGERVYIENAD
ncbi:MAG: hypothetical protein ACRD8Z_17890 [Nitrososphaeraceae archaeon]